MSPTPFDPKNATRSLAKQLGEAQPGEKVVDLPVGQIASDPAQHRRHFDHERLVQLGQSMQHGQELPVIVRPAKAGAGKSYVLVSGERRWRAAQLAGLKTLKAIVRQISEDDAKKIVTAQAAENWQREGLTAAEEVRLAAQLVDVYGGLAEAVVASGKPKTLLSKLTNIGKAGGAVARCLDERLCEDIETLYRLVRAARKDEAAVERLVGRWQADASARGGQRGQVDALLAKLEAKDGGDTVPPARDDAKGAARPTAAGPGRGGSKPAEETRRAGERAPSPATHGARGGTDGPAPAAATAEDARDPTGDAIVCTGATVDGELVELETAAGTYRFDRASLAEALGVTL